MQEGRGLGKGYDTRRWFERELSQYLSFGAAHGWVFLYSPERIHRKGKTLACVKPAKTRFNLRLESLGRYVLSH